MAENYSWEHISKVQYQVLKNHNKALLEMERRMIDQLDYAKKNNYKPNQTITDLLKIVRGELRYASMMAEKVKSIKESRPEKVVRLDLEYDEE